MASWVLTDTAKSEYESSWKIDGSQVSDAPSNFAIEKRTLRGGLSDGVDEIRVHNGAFQFSVLPTRGMGLWKAGQGRGVDLTTREASTEARFIYCFYACKIVGMV